MTPPNPPSPGANFATKPLELRQLALQGYKRIFWTGRPALGFRHGAGRFNAPPSTLAFTVLYAADTLACCLAETLIRDRSALLGGPAPITMEDLELRSVVEFESIGTLGMSTSPGPGRSGPAFLPPSQRRRITL